VSRLFDRILDGIAEMQPDSQVIDHLQSASDDRSLGGLFFQCLNEYLQKIEDAGWKDWQGNGLSSTIKKVEMDEDQRAARDKKPIEQQKRSETNQDPTRKKLKVTCKGETDRVLGYQTKPQSASNSTSSAPKTQEREGRTGSLSQLCPIEKSKLLDIKELRKFSSTLDRSPDSSSQSDSPKEAPIRRNKCTFFVFLLMAPILEP